MLGGKTAIVTGGARGIGLAIATEFSNQGATVIVCSRTKDQVDLAVSKLSEGGKEAFGITADVSKFEDCQKLTEFALSKTGRIDILVNNAGIYGPIGLVETTDPEGWNQVFAT